MNRRSFLITLCLMLLSAGLTLAGVRALSTDKPLGPVRAALLGALPVYPGAKILNETGPKDMAVRPVPNGVERDRFTVRWERTVSLDLSELPLVQPGELLQWYVSQHVERSGIRFGGSGGGSTLWLPDVRLSSDGTPLLGGRTDERGARYSFDSTHGLLSGWCFFRDFDATSLRPEVNADPRIVQGIRVAVVHLSLFESGFTDSDGLWPK